MHAGFALSVLGISAVLMSACQKKTVKTSGEDASSAAASPTVAVAEPFTLTVGSGGGFAGLYSGCILRSDGGVAFWRRMGAKPDSVTGEAKGSAAEIQGLLEQLKIAGALTLDHKHSGNLTALVRLQLGDSLYSWSWPDSDDEIPAPFQAWYPKAQAYCAGLESRPNP
jgi:hypothetical protein